MLFHLVFGSSLWHMTEAGAMKTRADPIKLAHLTRDQIIDELPVSRSSPDSVGGRWLSFDGVAVCMYCFGRAAAGAAVFAYMYGFMGVP